MFKYFNEDMTSEEARLLLFSLCKTKPDPEKREIKEEYFEVQPLILKKEMALASQGWTT